MSRDDLNSGIIAWFTRNSVAANLLMAIILIGGAITALFFVRTEMMPAFEVNSLTVNVAYPGAAPLEVEEGISQRIEEQVKNIEGIKKLTSISREGVGSVTVEVEEGYELQTVLDEVKIQVDAIPNFPAQAEKPIISTRKFQQSVLWLTISGELDEYAKKRVANQVREELLNLPEVSSATVVGARPYEVSIELSEQQLQEYGLTMEQVVNAIRNSSINIPGGSVKTDSGEILLRANNQAYNAADFSSIVLLTRADGTRLLVQDIATVRDGFVERESFTRFDGKPSVSVRVDSLGEQNVIDIANAVKSYVAKKKTELPASVTIDYWGDTTTFLQDRLELMTSNLWLGALLVFIILALFLRFKLAFWVMFGLPICFLGVIFVMPLEWPNLSINMMTLFGFILVLGIVVDDAIIIGESAWTSIEKEGVSEESVIKGTKKVAMPATFGVLTTIAAFIPMLMMPGLWSPIWASIGLIVMLCLVFSLIESKLILPAHLAHMDISENKYLTDTIDLSPRQQFANSLFEGDSFISKLVKFILLPITIPLFIIVSFYLNRAFFKRLFQSPKKWKVILKILLSPYAIILLCLYNLYWAIKFVLGHFRQKLSPKMKSVINNFYGPLVSKAVNNRYITLSLFVSAFILVIIGFNNAGFVRFVAFPDLPSDFIRVEVEMNEGALVEKTNATLAYIEKKLQETNQEYIDKYNIEPLNHALAWSSSNTNGEMFTELNKLDGTGLNSKLFLNDWREKVGSLAGVKSISFKMDGGPGGGAAVAIRLLSSDFEELRNASFELKQILAGYQGLFDISDSLSGGKKELKLNIKPEAEQLGLSLRELASQVRYGYYGAEVQRFLRDNEEVKVMVRYPKEQRNGLEDFYDMNVRTASGVEIPFSSVADYEIIDGVSSIRRVNGVRSNTIAASADKALVQPGEVIKEVMTKVIPELKKKYPSISTKLEGESKENAEMFKNLGKGGGLAIFIIYALMAIPLASYIKPFIVMSTIPFGIVGAVIGHMLLGYPMSMLSMFGLIALAGVVVNDSLIMVDFIGRARAKGLSLRESALSAGKQRFRAIVLTSLTTFFGLLPITFETSFQAQIVIPMAISLAFGILFATVITLIWVPCLYVVLADVKNLFLGKSETQDDTLSLENDTDNNSGYSEPVSRNASE